MSQTHRRHLHLVLGALVLLAAGPAGADTYLVDRLDDATTNGCDPAVPLDCGLRGALILANSNPGDDVVRLQAGTYSLSIPGTYEDLCQLGDPGVLIWGTGAAIESCTLVGDGGRAVWIAQAGSATIRNTLVVGECGGASQLTSLGGNLESPGNSCQLGSSDLVNVADPGLSALGFFGGPAPVHRPLATSPALDQPLAGPGCGTADQRGLSRPKDGDGNGAATCDIGAVELAGPGEVFVETFECGFTAGWSAVVE